MFSIRVILMSRNLARPKYHCKRAMRILIIIILAKCISQLQLKCNKWCNCEPLLSNSRKTCFWTQKDTSNWLTSGLPKRWRLARRRGLFAGHPSMLLQRSFSTRWAYCFFTKKSAKFFCDSCTKNNFNNWRYFPKRSSFKGGFLLSAGSR